MGLQQSPYGPFSAEGAGALRTIGHPHFWDRAMSRRHMLLGTAAVAGVMVGGRVVPPRFGRPAGAGTATDPRPIPGGFMTLDERRYHAHVPGRTNPLDPSSPINEPATITDFDGVVAIMVTQGTGKGVERGVEAPLYFDSDMRFMAGRYVGRDGEIHQGAFGFV